MIDRITAIESGIVDTLLSIQHPSGVIPGYNTFTSTGSVFINDEAYALDLVKAEKGIMYSDAINYINHDVDMYNGEDGTEYDIGQNSYSNTIIYKIISHITVTGDEINPRRAAQIRGNQLISDLKYAFGKNFTLNKTCNLIRYNSFNRIYTTNNELTQPMDIESYWVVEYTQSVDNPLSKECP